MLSFHDFVVGSRCKLILSVLIDVEKIPKNFLEKTFSNSGETFEGIRSTKHTGSSAFHHLTRMTQPIFTCS